MINLQYNKLRESIIKGIVYNPTSIISVRYTLLPVPDFCEYEPISMSVRCYKYQHFNLCEIPGIQKTPFSIRLGIFS